MNELQYPAQVTPQYPVQYPQQYSHGAPQMAPPAVTASEGNNPLLRVAEPLLTLITQLRHTVEQHNVEALRAQVIEEIKRFEHQLSSINYPVRGIIAARYCLCTTMDEAVLGQSWGTQSAWVQSSLLSIFQKETWGGERFYLILEDALRDIRTNIDLIELIYFLISLGFEGKFFGDEYRAAREEIRNRVFYHIRHARLKPERSLSPTWKNLRIPATMQQKKVILKRAFYTSLSVMFLLGLFYNIGVYRQAKPTLEVLSKLATVSPITTFSEVINRPIIIRHDDGEDS